MTEIHKFVDVIDVARFSNCSVCNTFIYTLPCQLDKDFEIFMKSLGGMRYPLDRFNIVRMDNDLIKLSSRIGRNWLDVKYKKDVEQVKQLFDLQLASYVGHRNNLIIEM